jgi:cell division protein FtsA
LEEDEAENLKVKYGNAIFETNDDEGPKTYLLEDEKRTIERKVLNEIIEARVEEIIANVWNQIELSGYQGDLMAGIVITGGGSNLKNLDEAIRSRTKISNVKIAKFVRTGVRSNGPDLLIKDGTQNTIIGLLNAGKESCCLVEAAKPLETSVKQEIPEQTLFPEDDDEQEEYDEKDALRAEEERKRKEEEKRRREEAELERKRLEQKRKEEKAAAKAAAKAAKKAEPSKIKTMFEKLTKDMFSDEGE